MFLDIGMPGIDGYSRECFARSSASRHVAKPADPETIESILETIFDRGARLS